MKQAIILIKLSVIFLFFTAFKSIGAADKTSVKITESENFYELKASYNTVKTAEIQKYMDDSMTGRKGFSFKNAQLDATLTLDSKITFYIKARPGELILKFDKRKNNAGDYGKFKKMCEGIRDIFGEK